MKPWGTFLAVLITLGALHGGRSNAAGAMSLSLDDAIAKALQDNPDVRLSAARSVEAQARLGEITSAFFPQLTGRLTYTRTDNPAVAFAMLLAQRRFSFNGTNFNHPGPTQDVRPELVATVPLFRGGQDYERREAARLGIEIAELDRDTVRNVLTDAVIAAYCMLLAGPEQVVVAQRSLEAVEAALRQANARLATGTGLKSDSLSLEVRHAAAEEALLRARNGLDQARTLLRGLLGMSLDEPLEAVDPLVDDDADLPQSIADAVGLALTRRPDVQAAARLITVREHELAAERAAYLPRLDLVGSYGQNSDTLELDRSRDNWLVGATAEIDLFSGMRTRHRIAAAESRVAQAHEAQRKLRLEIERDLQSALLALDDARARRLVTASATAAAEEALRLVFEQYRAGVATLSRYLEAEAARTAASTNAITARYDVRRAESAFRRALGQWSEVEQP